MDSWEWERSYRRGRDTASHPSFSSSLLDAIYRSIDEVDGKDTCKGANRAVSRGGDPELASIRKHQYYYHHAAPTAMLEKKKKNTTTTTTTTVAEKVVLRRRGEGVPVESIYRPPPHPPQHHRDHRYATNSTSTSSESSYGGFSSSEAESVAALSSVRPRAAPVSHRPVPPPATALEAKKKPKQEESPSSIRSRFRASRIYGELKKAKSPVSPGGRLASFLNTLFASAGHPKKAKPFSSSSAPSTAPPPPIITISGRGAGEDSTCSSASSYSRSCLSKTPSCRGKLASGGGAKRSVRFYPVSVIVGDDCRPCGEKSLCDDYTFYDREYVPRDLAAAAAPMRARNVAAEGKAVRDLMLGIGDEEEMEEDEEEEDDAASYSSSDLFELESVTAIGRRGGGELPVYETTHFHTNRAIAQGLIV